MSVALQRHLEDEIEPPLALKGRDDEKADRTVFNRRRFDWLDKIMADPDLPPAAFKLAYALAIKIMNARSRLCCPSQETISRAIGIKPRQVRNMLSLLVERGYLKVHRTGKNTSNRYSLLLGDRQESADHEDEATGNKTSSDRQDIASRSGKILPPNHRTQPSYNHTNGLKAVRNRSTIDMKEEGGRDYAPPSNRSRLQTDMMVDVPNIGLCGVERLLRNNSVIIRSADDGEIYRCSLFEDGKINPASIEKLEVDDDR